VIVEIFVLALASTIRPTSLAAVYALLSHSSRRTLMCAYVAGGLAFTILFGLVVVYVFHGIHVGSGTGHTKAIADIAGGSVALLFGVAILTGRIGAGQADDVPGTDSRWKGRLEQRLSTATAALAGPATHIPGLFYLIALNVIVAHEPRVPRGTLAVISFNAVWFALPILALVACIVRPATAREFVGSVEQWARAHAHAILLVVSFVVGTALIVRGALNL
jgi:cytochrome bd-type quinol oxidase subunit 2